MDKEGGFSANRFALKKCRTTEYHPPDHISKLPDEILCTILCFLTLKEAAVTSAVSRRWVHLWKSNTLLNFDATKALNSIRWTSKLTKTERVKYVNWVNHILSVHQASEIEEFRICFDLYKAHKQDIDDWLKFAFSRRVQRLELDLLRWGMYVTRNIELIYAFPTELIFAQSIGTPSPGGSLSSSLLDVKPLRNLCLKHVNVTDEAIKVFLLNCPFLESLIVHGLPGLVNLEVSGQSLMLRYLEIMHCERLNSVKICNTNLVGIKYFGCCKNVLLQDLPFLVELYIGGFELVGDAFSELSSCLPNLETLTFVFRRAGFYSANVKLLEFPEPSRLKQLTLVLETTSDLSLLEFASLANVFPCLEKCAIELWWASNSQCRGIRQLKKVPHCIHPCLKVVELRGYYGRKSDVELAMYFIENAIALEELIVDPRYQKNTHFRAPKGKSEINAEATAREIAKQQFKGMTVPGLIKLKIL